jgi:nucleotide-binding universal stress UspA family protein
MSRVPAKKVATAAAGATDEAFSRPVRKRSGSEGAERVERGLVFVPHVQSGGSHAPTVYFNESKTQPKVKQVTGEIVDIIASLELNADLIVIPTEQRQGQLNPLFGTTSEQLLRDTSCPVLAIPV